MSISIPLRFETRYDPDLQSEGVQFNLIRLIGDVDFETPKGWSSRYQAIIDTGSPANIIPEFVWKQAINRLILTKTISLSGLGSGRISGYLGEVTARISYRSVSSGPIRMRAFLVDSDEVPLILGFEDFLSTGILISDYPRNVASIQFGFDSS